MYKISGYVTHGEKNGRKIGFPTVNISLDTLEIEDATYCLNIEYNNAIFKGVGTYLKAKKTFEAHIFDFSQEIYGEEIHIYIKSKIRINRKFKNFEELKLQISKDVVIAKEKTHTVLSFGSFDIIHPGHSYYLSEARKYGENLITIVATDENIKRIKGQSTHNKINKRLSDIETLNISDEIVPGSNKNPLKWIEIHKPNSICLGYDQKGPFIEKIDEQLKELNLTTQVIRILPFKPEIYKSSLLKSKK